MSTTRLQHTDATAFDRLGVDMLLDGVAVRGFFSGAYAQAFDGMATTSSAATLPTALCTAITPTSLLVVGGTTYRVRSPQPDGTGLTTLLLERQAS